MEEHLYHYKAKVLRVVDGDTIDVIIDVGFAMSFGNESAPQRLRLNRINASESRTRNLEEKARGIAAKEYLIQFLLDHRMEVILKTHKDDAFGRWLSDVYCGDICVNDHLVFKGHAVYKEY